jgi:hypothetical protein
MKYPDERNFISTHDRPFTDIRIGHLSFTACFLILLTHARIISAHRLFNVCEN